MADHRVFQNVTPPFILLDDNYRQDGSSYFFKDCEKVSSAYTADDIVVLCEEIDALTNAGLYAAGYVSYEAASAFDPHMVVKSSDKRRPNAQFGFFKQVEALDHAAAEGLLEKRQTNSGYELSNLTFLENEETFRKNVQAIKRHLYQGDTYQTNYTMGCEFDVEGDLTQFYQDLRRAQPVPYGAYLQFNERTILSRSPELFFEKRGSTLRTRPMKGTAAKHDDDRVNTVHKNRLRHDEKTRAENIIIVDLLRNDLGRIAEPGSLEVEDLLMVETYRSLYQMTSSIRCTISDAVTLLDIFRALFPCGSVTGAPKIRTMEIIAALEAGPRGVYTGAIGYVTPQMEMCFSVPIRTITIDQAAPKNRAYLGLGGGIVYDSEATAEFAECMGKGRFLFDLFDRPFGEDAHETAALANALASE